jgi:predicted Zn-dependent protease
MRHDRRQFVTGMAAATASAGLCACTTVNPATGRSSFTGMYSVEDDVRLGRQEHPKITKEFGGAYENPRLQRYVDEVGGRLARRTEYGQFRYTFTLLNTPIVNAFALPGGYVYLSRGLLTLASNEAEMAGVLAHEIGHVVARHSAERMSRVQMTQFGLLAGALFGLPQPVMQIGQSIALLSIQSYSREQELEADTLAVRYMSRTGYDPNAMVTFLSSLREHSMVEAKMKGLPPGKIDEFNMMSTHPRTSVRVEKAMASAAAARPRNPRIGQDIYLAKIDGMMFGDDPAQGVVRGNLFQHPAMRFEFRAPPGFRIVNGKDEIIAEHPRGAAIVFDIAPIKASRHMTAYLQNEWAAKTALKGVERINVNGMEAATGTLSTRDQRRGPVDLRAIAIRRNARSAFRFLFISPAKDTGRLSLPFRNTTYSFRRLNRAEAARIRPLRLLLVNVGPRDSIRGLAKTLPFGRFNEAWFRVLNDMKPGQPLRRNRRIKVVAA